MVLGAGRLLSCSCNNCLALMVTCGSFILVLGVAGADPAQLERSEDRVVRDVKDSLLSAVGLNTCTGMALNCSAGILIWKNETKSDEPAAADPHPVSTLPADYLSAHFTLLSPAEHSKPCVGADCADLALLYAVLHSH